MLAYLEQEGLAENTVVIFSSDQGFFLGEHGWFDKRWIFEESLRTPLLARWPGQTKPGSVNGDIVSLVDFAETFLDLAGIAAPADMQGRSLRPLLAGEVPADWRKEFYYHYYEYPEPHHVSPHYGVITEKYKLVHYYGVGHDAVDLFDSAKDPLELKSFAGQKEYAEIQADLEARLKRLRTELQVPEVDDPDATGERTHRERQAKAAKNAGKKKAEGEK
jgi:arylsulfatase A-like enzyme